MGTESQFSSQRLKGKVVQSSANDKYDNNDAQYTGKRKIKRTTKDWWVEGLRVLGICIVGGLVLSTALAIIRGGLRGAVTMTTSLPSGTIPKVAVSSSSGTIPTVTDCDWDTEWECYYLRYVDLHQNNLERTQETAKRHYMEHGKAEGRNCHC